MNVSCVKFCISTSGEPFASAASADLVEEIPPSPSDVCSSGLFEDNPPEGRLNFTGGSRLGAIVVETEKEEILGQEKVLPRGQLPLIWSQCGAASICHETL